MPQNKAEIIALLRRSRLLTDDQLRFAESVDSNDPKKIIRQLFKQEWLTRWQCLTLLEGRCQFHLGKYRLNDLLGTGGMGAVFKAAHEVMRNTVAIKVLKAKLAEKETGIPRFLREIRVAASLDSPHIVRAFDADKEGDKYYLVMEYVDGRDLKTVMSEASRPETPWLCECMRQAALGLQHALECGTVHRDIKPANLMITGDNEGMPLLKILDFGLAKFDREADGNPLTSVGQAVGTPDYIAPEQARCSSKADIRADIYSLGCTFFELFTGQLPFPYGSVNDKLLARVKNEPPRVTTLRPDFPPELDEIIAKSMRKNPDERFQTPAELATALGPFSLKRGLTVGYGQSAPNIQIPSEILEIPPEETADLPIQTPPAGASPGPSAPPAVSPSLPQVAAGQAAATPRTTPVNTAQAPEQTAARVPVGAPAAGRGAETASPNREQTAAQAATTSQTALMR
ncbi:MAG: serine/threonine protein kinase, partial [Planctomycetaceae bacterium]